MAVKHNRIWLHIDLNHIAAFQAAITINDWILKKGIEILNVAGPRASKDPKIYKDALNIIESTYYLALVQGNTSGARPDHDPVSVAANPPLKKPQNLNEAVERLISQMPLKDKTTVANMSQDELPNLNLTLGGYIMDNFGLLSGNHNLINSCRLEADGSFQREEDAVAIIIKDLWQKLRQTHRLRVVK
jgi:hypothetical protein